VQGDRPREPRKQTRGTQPALQQEKRALAFRSDLPFTQHPTPLIMLITSFTQPHSQPASSCCAALRCTALHCAALRCTALHTAFFGSLFGSISQPRLILPYLCGLATLACMPACLTFLFLVQAPGSEVGKYSRTYADSLGLRSLDGPGST
jgi:hypothetical protein